MAIARETHEGAVAAAPQPAPLTGVLASLALCMLLPSLGTSIANVALPTLAAAFQASFQQVQWVVIAYLLATTTLVVGAGRLGDLIGRRRLLMAGIALFAAASALCGLAPGLGWLVAARAAQGLGAAVMMALPLAFVGETVPRHRTGSAMGLLGTMSAVGTALGPSLGGLLLAGAGWPAIFFVTLPLSGLALLMVPRHLPADRPAPALDAAGRSRFDLAGTLLLALTLAAYALAMTWGRGRFGALNAALLAAAGVGAMLFLRIEAKAVSPLIQPARLRDPALGASLVMSLLVSTVVMATLVVGPFYLAHALGLGAAGVGLAMSAGPAVSALTGVPAGRLVDRWGAPRVTALGLCGMVVGCLALCLAPAAWGVAGYALPLVITTAGYALFQAANNTTVMAGVAPDQRGVISGLLTLSRNLGLVTGATLMGAVFTVATQAVDISPARPEAVATGMRATFALAAGLLVVALVVAWRSRGSALHRPPAR